MPRQGALRAKDSSLQLLRLVTARQRAHFT
jgi:hypothetical protein